MTTGDETDPHHRLPCAQRSCDVVGVFLVDARGWVLQERDEHPRDRPDRWGVVGGHVDAGEEWSSAMRRELAIGDDDIVCGEGRQIVFVDPARLGELDLAESTEHFLPRLLESDAYRRLTAPRG